MKLLILGGTWFLGKHIVEAAESRGHTVTVFNRGRHNDELSPEIERLVGDRDGGLDALKDRQWDAVIDTCGYVPRVVRLSAELLKDASEHYLFTSSMSVYADVSSKGLAEDAPVAKLQDETTERVTGETYGALKALCEAVVEEVFADRSVRVRAGLIVGPNDYIDRFTYWVRRIASGGDVLAPGERDRAIQLIDARDLADWIIHLAEDRITGTFNASGPNYRLTMGRFLEECVSVTGSDARLCWVTDQFLCERNVGAWNEVPLWIPEEHTPKFKGMFAFDLSKGISADLRFRPLSETIRDTREWLRSDPDQSAIVQEFGIEGLNTAMKPEREAALLREWRESHP